MTGTQKGSKSAVDLQRICHLLFNFASFSGQTEGVIVSAVLTHQFPHENCLHGVGMDIIKLAETYPVAFREPLLWFYERTPCSICRRSVVEELHKRQLVPKEIWEECLDDCDDGLRELAQKACNACSCQISPHLFSKSFYINELRGIKPTKTRPPIHL